MKCGKERDDDVWEWWRSKDGETDTKRGQMKNYGRDKTESLRNRVVQFTNDAAQGGARICRCATDSVHCRVWWKDKFPRFSVFWNCGSSDNRSTTIRWSMSFSWCRGFVPPSKKKQKAWLRLPESLVKSQIVCVVKIVLCELRNWA